MFGLIYRLLPMPVRIGISVALAVVFTCMWYFVGNYESSSVEFGPNADEARKRSQLPKDFLPLHPSSKMTAEQEERRKRPFSPGTLTVTAYFDMPVVESTVRDFYHDSLAKEGWKIESEKRTDEETNIQVSKDKMQGVIHITHEDAGSDLDLAVTTEDPSAK